MTDITMALKELLRKHELDIVSDFLREGVQVIMQIATRQRIHFMGIPLQFGILIVRLLNYLEYCIEARKIVYG